MIWHGVATAIVSSRDGISSSFIVSSFVNYCYGLYGRYNQIVNTRCGVVLRDMCPLLRLLAMCNNAAILYLCY